MNVTKLFTSIILFYCCISVVNAQFCPYYPEIEGPTCGGTCVPEGWEVIDPSPQLLDPTSICGGLPPSPSGGNAQFLIASNVTNLALEIMGTTVTGLTEGCEYYFAFYYITCTSLPLQCCGGFGIEIDGVPFEEYPPEDDWTLVEICAEAQSSEIEIVLYPIWNGPSEWGSIFVDSAPCMLDICSSNPEATFEFPDFCSDYGELVFPTESIEGIVGTWETPSINTNDYPGETFYNIFTPSPDNGDCPLPFEVEIVIDEFISPTFDFQLEYCTTYDQVISFPNNSLEGINGTWEPDEILLEDYEENTIPIVFTPNFTYCSEEIQLELDIDPGETPEFELPETYCASEGIITLDEQSSNGIYGIWDQQIFDPIDEIGEFTVTFTPNQVGCILDYEYTFEILEFIPLNFDTLGPFCRNSGLVTLNATSDEGEKGSWSIPQFYPDTIQDSILIVTWSPLNNFEPCLKDTTVSIQIIDAEPSDFELPETICSSVGFYEFPELSIDSIPGIWTIPTIDLNEFAGQTVFSTFIPDSNYCAAPFEWMLEIAVITELEFDLDSIICELSEAYDLPLNANDGTPGSWNINPIDPAGLGGQNINLTFTAEEEYDCVDNYNFDLEVEEEIIAEFVLPEYFCWDDDNYILPQSSLNNIIGQWSDPEIEVATQQGQTLVLTFSPSNSECADEFIYTVNILSEWEWDLSKLDPSSCSSDDGSINIVTNEPDLEYSFDGGITWSDQVTYQNLSEGNYTLLSRNSNVPDCISQRSIDLISPDAPELEDIVIVPISDCDNFNGMITITASGNQLLYSIDGGTNWQAQNIFENLGPGEYVIFVQDPNTNCLVEGIAQIENIIPTQIFNVDVFDNSDCDVEAGSIFIDAEGSNLEYSIDGGLTWSSNNQFDNLPAGNYEIQVQSIEFSNCDDFAIVEISAPDYPEINNIQLTDPSSCSPAAGSIEIIAMGENLEYSINGGIDWTIENVFNDLPPGEYEIIIREANMLNCLDMETISLVLFQDGLSNASVNIIPPSACDESDGIAEIIIFESNVEYSIDGGSTWQRDNRFIGLAPGSYSVIVRDIDINDCRTQVEFEIENPICPCGELQFDFNVSPVFCLEDDNGAVSIINIYGIENPDYTIEWANGLTGMNLNNLAEGWQDFTVYYDEDCVWEDSIYIDAIDPLTFGLLTFDPNCEGSEDGIIEIVDIVGGSGSVSYSLDSVVYQSNSVFYNLSPADYTVYVLDEDNCLQSELVSLNDGLSLDFELPEILPIEVGDSVYLNPLINASTIDSFEWTPNQGILNPGELVALVSPNQTTEYSLVVYFGNCAERRTTLIEVLPEEIAEENIYLGNTFSPNGDGNNDRFFLQSKMSTTINVHEFNIYDRWGNLVFNKINPTINSQEDGWDGYYNNQKVVSGVFVYYVSFEINGKKYVKTGTVTVFN